MSIYNLTNDTIVHVPNTHYININGREETERWWDYVRLGFLTFLFDFLTSFSSTSSTGSSLICFLFFFSSLYSSSSGASNSVSLSFFLSSDLSFATLRFSAFFFASLCCSLRKYSPLSSCKSILLGVGAGGNGVYDFLTLTSWGFFLLLVVFFLNCGRNRLQSSWDKLGS